MITGVKTRKGTEAITSDHWHVVHSRYLGTGQSRPFSRSISSEHDDRGECVKAARALVARLRADAGALPQDERDEVFVRKPNFKSLKLSKRRIKGAPAPKQDDA